MLRIFDNNKSTSEIKSQKKTIPAQYIDQKRIVDINKLLNRVRMDKKNETKRKMILISTLLALVIIVGLFSVN